MAAKSGFDLDGASLADLEAHRQKVEAKITSLRAAKRDDVLAQVRELLASIGETPESAFGAGRRRTTPATTQKVGRGSVKAKFQDKETGDSWSGRGKQPIWLRERLAAGRKLEEFEVR
jgi:DNA-binding protein H-NS